MALSDRGTVNKSHIRLLETIAGLTDDDARRPSLLPGWTVGHVLTHLARNADSHVRMLAAAGRGEVADQYEGGRAGRAAAIEAGVGRPEPELAADVARSIDRLEAAWTAAADDVWEHGRGRVATGGEWPVADLPFRRWREVELHHADLGLGFGWQDWSAAYVERELPVTIAGLGARLPPAGALRLVATDTGATWTVPPDRPDPVEVAAPSRRLLAWLVGRGDASSGLPPLTGWEG